MPSAAYNISNREEDKIRGRDQSFRNCIVTMFVFIMICVIILVATIPFRNANTRNNRDQDWSGSRTEKQFITTENTKTTLNYPGTLSTKSDTTTTSSTIKSSTATIDEKTTLKSSTKYIDITPREKNELTTDPSLPSSTTIENKNTAAVSTARFDERNEFRTTNRQYMTPLSTITIRNNDEMTSEKDRHTSDVSATAIDEETKFKTTNQYVERLSTTTNRNNIEKFSRTMSDNVIPISSSIFVPSSRNADAVSTTISSQAKTSEIISSTDDSTAFSSEASTQSSVGIESSSFSSSIEPKLSVTEQGGFFYTEETEGSTAVSLTESTFDYSSYTEELIISDDEENSTSLKRLVIRIYSGNESHTSENETDLSWVDDVISSTPSYQKNSSDEIENDSSTLYGITESHYKISTENFSSTESQIASITPDHRDEDETTMMTYTDDNFIQSTPNISNQFIDYSLEENDTTAIDNLCLSGQCKQFSSKILSYMNHSADPCEDFYEYACGGMEADPYINNMNLADQAFDRIKNELKKSETDQKNPAIFKDYYNSCIQYYQEITEDKKIQQAKEMLAKIGQFYTASDWPNNSYSGITKLIANMMIYNSPLLFDIVPDVNEIDPRKFILRLGPINDHHNLFPNIEENSCILQTDEILSDDIDMEKQYKFYKNCRNNEQQQSRNILKALKVFDIFNHIDNTSNKFGLIEKIAIDIDNRIIKMFSNYSSLSEIRMAYKSKNYTIITLGALEVQSKFINWTELIYTITGAQLTSNTELQVYFEDQLIRALKSLEKFRELHELNNAILGLYAENLYEQFIKPKTSGDFEKQCLHTAMNYLPNEASQLYLSSFTKMQIDFMNATMYKVFTDLKETLKLKFERAQWATQAGRKELLKKIEGIQMSVPNNLYIKNISNINITYDFFDNTVLLMKKFREDMYRNIDKIPSSPEQLWTYFARPFQSHSQAIYSLNIILIPFGAVEMTKVLQNDQNFYYITLATIGNLIAREIAHHFDSNGIFYWNGTRDSAFAHLNDEFTKANYDSYINCHSNLLFQEPMNLLLPALNKHIRITIPQTTLNERLSDVMGVRLAHDTLARMESTSSKLLPWLDLDIHKLFYLAYAQKYCTKEPFIASYISLYENSIIPSRLKIFFAAINNKILGELWKCREGSPVLPNAACDVFPYLDYQIIAIPNM